jgi:hypothetical protein
MKINCLISAVILAYSKLIANVAIANDEPSVKMSKSGICHERGSTYHSKTKTTRHTTLWRTACELEVDDRSDENELRAFLKI